jgi:metal-responsive CopG/Arc/MetJ family transcriptional regulator
MKEREKVTISLKTYVLKEIDYKRGLVPRSTYINDLLEQALGLKHDKALVR